MSLHKGPQYQLFGISLLENISGIDSLPGTRLHRYCSAFPRNPSAYLRLLKRLPSLPVGSLILSPEFSIPVAFLDIYSEQTRLDLDIESAG